MDQNVTISLLIFDKKFLLLRKINFRGVFVNKK
jgi:hypothetical protein